MGPTNRTASMSADVGNPAAREVTFTQLAEAYTEQARGLVDGGADVLLVETVFDTLNAKAALYAIDTLAAQLGRAIPVMISGTLADASGRTLSGQTVEAFCTSLSHAQLLSLGLNCAYGAKQLLPYLERLAETAPFRISAHPNAGLPNVMGGYDETPEMFAEDVGEYMRRGLVNIVGGCCGTTPEHICALKQAVGSMPVHMPLTKKRRMLASERMHVEIRLDGKFMVIGERINPTGKKKLQAELKEGSLSMVRTMATEQEENGAQILDINMGMNGIDEKQMMLDAIYEVTSTVDLPLCIDCLLYTSPSPRDCS